MKKILLFTIFTVSLFSFTIDEISAYGSPEELQEKLASMKNSDEVEKFEKQEIENKIVSEETVSLEKNITLSEENKIETKNSSSMKNFVFKYKNDNEVVRERDEKQIKQKDEELKRFGDSFFANQNSANLDTIPIPDHYRINKNDVFSIWVYGAKSLNLELKVDRNGNLNLDGIGAFYVKNMRFDEVKNNLKNKLEKTYKNSKASINIVQTTPIQITVAGEVQNGGIYNIPAFSSIKDALVIVGGISENGSLRNIKLLPNGNKKMARSFDFYKLMLDGDKLDAEYPLQNGDVILVGKSEKSISIVGEVQKSGIFELQKDENLQKLLSLCGGISPTGNDKIAKLSRLENNKRVVKEIDLNENLRLQNGDLITVFPINLNQSETIYIYGNVLRNGERGFYNGLQLSQVLQSEKNNFLKNTEVNFAILKRHNRESFSDEMIPFSISEVLENSFDLELQHGDEIYIFNKAELKESPYIYVSGKVVSESGRFQFFKNMKLGDLKKFIKFKSEIFQDGKRTRISLSNEVKVSRNLRENVEILFLDIQEDTNFELQPFDEIVFFDKLEREKPKTASIFGQVLNSGTFQIDENTDINKLIKMAKGLKQEAYFEKFEVVRYWVEDGERKYKVIEKSLSEAMEENFQIQEYDEVSIFRIPNWLDKETVKISGEVRFPGEYVINKGDTLQTLIDRAGGFLPTAFFRGAVFTRNSIKNLQKKQLESSVRKLKNDSLYLLSQPKSVGESEGEKLGILKVIDSLVAEMRDFEPNGRVSIDIENERNFLLENGDSLHIPTKIETVSVIGEVLNPNTFFFENQTEIEYYLDKSGGLNHKADIDNIYIVHPNGEAQKYETGFLFGFGSEVETGDIIVVPLKIETSSYTNIAKDVTQILYQLAITAVSLKTVGIF
ncbi:periplasmic protein involved in polysaccharide export [Thiovulum sp. ES]|nr:periplasmic protein involved in polysaccharide export [Thiovulum sp. ES]